MRLSENEAANRSAIFPTLNHLGHALYKNNELKLAADTYIESFNIQVSIVTGVSNNGLQDFGLKLNSIKDQVATMEQKDEDVTDISESLGGIANILRYLGLVIQEQGEFEAAEQEYLSALAIADDDPLTHHNIGILYDLYLGIPHLALTHYQRYQELTGEGDRRVAGWIVDLQRRHVSLAEEVL